MDPHADTNFDLARPAPGGQGALGVDRAAQAICRSRERHEERIALRVDLVTVPGREGVAQDPTLLGQHLGISAAEAFQQSGGAFDIGEEERDRAARRGLSFAGPRCVWRARPLPLCGHSLP